MAKSTLYFIIIFTLAGCVGGIGFAKKEKIIGNYYLIAGDIEEDMCISFHEEKDGSIYGTIINATVFAVGFNNKYIIAKQHPRIFPQPCDKNVTNYFILPIKKEMDWKTKNGLIGPLSIQQFNQTKKELDIPDSVKFTMVIESLK